MHILECVQGETPGARTGRRVGAPFIISSAAGIAPPIQRALDTAVPARMIATLEMELISDRSMISELMAILDRVAFPVVHPIDQLIRERYR